MRKLTGVLCALGILVFAGTATAEGTSQVGFYFGSSDFDKSTLDGETYDIDGESVGLIYRISTPVEGSGGFAGLEIGVAKEFVSEKHTESDDNLSLSARSSVEWSMDFMPRLGAKFGDVSLSLAAGLSFIQEEFKLSVNVNGTSIPIVDNTQWHTGFKIAPGIDYELSENLTLFGQVQYAKYDSKTYSGSGFSFDIKPEMLGVRAGMLYRF